MALVVLLLLGLLAGATGVFFAQRAAGRDEPASSAADETLITVVSTPVTGRDEAAGGNTPRSTAASGTLPAPTASNGAPAATASTLRMAPPVTMAPPVAAASQPPTTPPSVVLDARVARTCGASGTGDCFLSIRSSPSGSAVELGRLDEGSGVRVICQVFGTRATSSVLGTSSDVWARLSNGGYVANIYLDGAGLDPLRMTHPCPS